MDAGSPLADQRHDLRQRFLQRLLALEPRSCLDVGCGAGELVGAAARRGLFAVGIEPGEPGQPADGPPRVRAHAGHLPFADASFDWVTLRHVPHHLEDLPRALADAWRVARRGLLVAEPWFDEARPDQRFALRADRWLKRQDRRTGRYHGDALSADELRAALGREARVEVETFRPERRWTAGDLGEEAAAATGGLSLDEDEQRELTSLVEVARRGHMTLPGTLIVTLAKG